MEQLDKLRARIKAEARYIGKKPYSHNIVSIVLQQIDKEFGREEANRAVRDFDLVRKGYREQE